MTNVTRAFRFNTSEHFRLAAAFTFCRLPFDLDFDRVKRGCSELSI